MKNQKGQVLLIVLLIAAAIGGYLFYTNYSNNRSKIISSPTIQQVTQPSSTTTDEIANWKTYTSKYGEFSFKYPPNWYTENVPGFPEGNNVSFFLVGTKADHGYGDHKGNEVFSFELSDDNRTLEELQKNYYSNATNLTVSSKPAIKTTFNLYIIKPSVTKKLNLVGGLKEAQQYLDQILSTFKFQ